MLKSEKSSCVRDVAGAEPVTVQALWPVVFDRIQMFDDFSREFNRF